MYRTAFANKFRPEFCEHRVDIHQSAPVFIHLHRIIGLMEGIFCKRYGMLQLIRPGVDLSFNAHLLKLLKQHKVKIGYTQRRETKLRTAAIAGDQQELVIDEIKNHLKASSFKRNAACSQSPSRHI